MNYLAIPGLKFFCGDELLSLVPLTFEEKRELIISMVAKRFKIRRYEIFIRSRKTEICRTRQVVMYFFHNILDMGCVDIGKFFSMDHTSAIHSIKAVQDLIDTNLEFRDEIRYLKKYFEANK